MHYNHLCSLVTNCLLPVYCVAVYIPTAFSSSQLRVSLLHEMASAEKVPDPTTIELPPSPSPSLSPSPSRRDAPSPTHNPKFRPVYRYHTKDTASLDLDDYFRGPHNIQKHSKWPFILRLQGSVTPTMILPLLLIGGWSTMITCISKFVSDLSVNSVLLTVLGFVVGLALSF